MIRQVLFPNKIQAAFQNVSFRSLRKKNHESDLADIPENFSATGGQKRSALRKRHWLSGIFFIRHRRLRRTIKLSGRALSSTLGLIILLVLFTLVGAAIFVACEAPSETVVRKRINTERKRMLENMWKLAMKVNQTTENFIEEGDVLLKNYTVVIVETSQSGIVATESESLESPKKWNYRGAVFYCLTVYTTIGYGHITPVTKAGRIITMIYALIGIPLCLIVLVKVGVVFNRILRLANHLLRKSHRRIIFYWRSRNKVILDTERCPLREDLRRLKNLYRQQDSALDISVSGSLILLLVYILLGASLYSHRETWSYFEAIYFVFISISTIGFGDVVPKHSEYFILVSFYIFIGWALVSMVVNVTVQHTAEKFRRAKTKLRRLMAKEVLPIHIVKEVNVSKEDSNSSQTIHSEVPFTMYRDNSMLKNLKTLNK